MSTKFLKVNNKQFLSSKLIGVSTFFILNLPVISLISSKFCSKNFIWGTGSIAAFISKKSSEKFIPHNSLTSLGEGNSTFSPFLTILFFFVFC